MTEPDDDLPPLPLGPDAPPPSIPANKRLGSTAKAAKRMEMANRRRNVAALSIARVDERTIARTLGVSLDTVKCDRVKILARWREASERDILDARAHASAALDHDETRLRSLYDRLERGVPDPIDPTRLLTPPDFEAAVEVYDRILKIQERRARLLGLDAPEQKEIRFPVAWRGATVVRDEPRPRDNALAAIEILLAVGVLDAVRLGNAIEVEPLPPLIPPVVDVGPARSVDAPAADPVYPDDADAETGRVSVDPDS